MMITISILLENRNQRPTKIERRTRLQRVGYSSDTLQLRAINDANVFNINNHLVDILVYNSNALTIYKDIPEQHVSLATAMTSEYILYKVIHSFDTTIFKKSGLNICRLADWHAVLKMREQARTKFENAFHSEFEERMQNYTRYDAQSFYDAMIFNMDSLRKYMLELILHQQRTPQLLKQKKLIQTQKDHSHPIPALNVDSLKVDFVVIQNTCSEKEDSNSETASNKLVKECNLNSETKDVHAIKYKMSKAKERCMAYFRSLHSHLQVLSKDDLKGTRIEHGFKRAFMSLFGQDVDTFTSTMLLNVDQLQKQLDKDEFQEDGSMAAFWVVQHFRDTLLQHLGNVKKSVAERTRHQRRKKGRVNKRRMQTQERNDTDVDDADIGLIYDEEPMMWCVDQYPETCQVKSPMLDSSPDNQTTEYSKQSLESENILLKETVAQFQKDFLRMEAHCIALELKYQNQSLKSGQHGQILNETSNKAKIEKEFDVLETMNIELEHSVATLRLRTDTSLLANNAELKAQILEKSMVAEKDDISETIVKVDSQMMIQKYDEQVEKGIVEIFFVGTEYQLADLFTKALPEDRFKYLVRRLGMRCLTPKELKILANEST
ncbi:hypothetical protein Tco_0404265 [Tanacetum coccineum]